MAAQSDALLAAEAIYDFGSTGIGRIIRYALAQGGFCILVASLGEIVPDVAFQHPAVSAVLAVIAVQVCVHPIQCVVYTLAALAGAIIADKTAGYLRIEYIVAQAALKLPVLDSGRYDFPLLRLMNREALIRVDAVFAVQQTLPEFVCVFQRVGGIRRYAVLPHHAPAALLKPFVQLAERNCLVVFFSHRNNRRE